MNPLQWIAESIRNAKTLPKMYYGLHMCEGVAEYSEPENNGGEPYRIMIGEDCLKQMDETFAGKPLYVLHRDKVDLENLQTDADGYVIKSFYNPLDGKHWAQFMIVSDAGHEAIEKGWKLSNSYVPKEWAGGGKWHNVDYLKEVMKGEYEHLASVPDPRYEESIILTPEEFKTYNSEKELELKRLANSKGDHPMFFKREKVSNDKAKELEGLALQLKSGREVTIVQLKNEMEAHEDEKNKNDDMEAKGEYPMANDSHMVELTHGESKEKMNVGDLVKKYNDLFAEHEKLKAGKQNGDDDADAAKKAAELAAHEAAEAKKNSEEAAKKEEEAKKNSLAKEAAAKKALEDAEKKKNFDKLNNAGNGHDAQPSAVIETAEDRVARGKQLFGAH